MVSRIEGILLEIGLPKEAHPPILLAGGRIKIEFEKVPKGDYHCRKTALLMKKKIVGALEIAGFDLNFQDANVVFITEATQQ